LNNKGANVAYFERMDIAEAYCLLEWDCNKGGWLQERPSNQRRKEATAVQLHRMQFRSSSCLSFDNLTENGKQIYLEQVQKLGLPCDDEQTARIQEFLA
jgi:hypothetical protein